MCFYYALMMWIKYRGKVFIQVNPFVHVIVSGDGYCWHGTKKGGKWHVERLDADALARWFIQK